MTEITNVMGNELMKVLEAFIDIKLAIQQRKNASDFREAYKMVDTSLVPMRKTLSDALSIALKITAIEPLNDVQEHLQQYVNTKNIELTR